MIDFTIRACTLLILLTFPWCKNFLTERKATPVSLDDGYESPIEDCSRTLIIVLGPSAVASFLFPLLLSIPLLSSWNK